MMGVALALQRRGHEITFLVNGYFEETAKRFGLEYVELGTKQQFLEATSHPDLWHPVRGFGHIWRSGIEMTLRPQYEMLEERFRPGETVAITNCFGFGALAAQEKLGLPLITLHLQPAVMWSNIAPPHLPGSFGPRWMRRLQYWVGERIFIDPVACPGLNAFRQELDLPPIRHITHAWHSPWCVGCLFPDWFCPPQDDWPDNLIQTDFPLWDEPSEQLPAEVETFLQAGEPPIVFTPGSANIFGREFFEAAVQACQSLNRRGVFLTRFPDQIPPDLPNGVVHFSYVPFSQLLSRSAAVVHHGGIGSTAQGLTAGIPQLIMALAHDQFDNGKRIKDFGIGDWLTKSKFKGPAVARRLESLLASNATKEACEGFAHKLAARDGADRTAQAIEEFASNHLSPPRR